METCKENRVRGGSSWADAMIRANYDSMNYAKTMIARVIERCELKQYGIEVFFSETDFLLVHNDRLLHKMNFETVEEYRCKGLYSFEREIEKQLGKFLII